MIVSQGRSPSDLVRFNRRFCTGVVSLVLTGDSTVRGLGRFADQ